MHEKKNSKITKYKKNTKPNTKLAAHGSVHLTNVVFNRKDSPKAIIGAMIPLPEARPKGGNPLLVTKPFNLNSSDQYMERSEEIPFNLYVNNDF